MIYFPLVFYRESGSALGETYLLDLPVEGDEVADLEVGKGVQKLLVLAVVETNALLNVFLGLLVDFLEEGQTAGGRQQRMGLADVLEKGSPTGLLNGTGNAVEVETELVAEFGDAFGVEEAEAVLAGFGLVYFHGVGDVLEGEAVFPVLSAFPVIPVLPAFFVFPVQHSYRSR